MSLQGREVYDFGPFTVEPKERTLLRDGQAVPLPPKAFDLLVVLVTRASRLVTKEELLREVWPEAFVEEANLSYTVSLLRKALGDEGERHQYIDTVPKQGYRFVAPVTGPPAEPILAASHQAEPAPAKRSKRPSGAAFVVGTVVLLLLAGLGAWAWRGRGAPASHVTLAVLPFENLGSDPEREYLADGLTEDTIASLGQIDPEHLSVIGRTSTMAYKRTRKSLAAIGGELSVDYLVESSVRAEGGRLRVTSKLIRVRDQVQVWAETYDREPTSLLGLQRELSTAVAEQIRLRLSPERLVALARRHTRNADAYDLYLRGRYFWFHLTAPTTRRAIEYYSRATELDPDYALAWSGLADAYAASPINGDAPPLQVWPRARDAVAQAIRAEPNLAEAQASLGLFKFWLDWDWPAAEAALRRSIALDPSYPDGPRMLGVVLSHMGRHEEARTAMRRARELDPLSAMIQALSAQVAFSARDPAAAVQFAREAIVVDPEFFVGYYQLGQAYEQEGKTDLALEALTSAARFSNSNSKSISLRGYLSAKAGKADAAREVLTTLVAVSRERYVPPYAMALVHAGLGEREAVFEWLNKAYTAHDVHLTMLPVDPKWDPYRADPRFSALVARCGFMHPASTAPPTP